MKVLEARFHPPAADGPAYIVVGQIIVESSGDGQIMRVQPSASLGRHRAPATMLATLRYLVHLTASGSWERLQALCNRHWTFVPIEPVAFDVPPPPTPPGRQLDDGSG